MKISRKKRLWFGLGLAALAFAAAFYFTGPLRWLGSPTVAILSAPTRVETFKLDGQGGQIEGQPNAIDRYAIVGRGQELGRREASLLGHLLTAPGNYVMGPLSFDACQIRPGVAFRFWKGPQFVDVIVCFWCGHILMDTHDDSGKIIHRYVTPFPVGELTGFVRKAFPNDPQMQGVLSEYELREPGQHDNH